MPKWQALDHVDKKNEVDLRSTYHIQNEHENLQYASRIRQQYPIGN